MGELSAGPLLARNARDRAFRQAVLQEVEAQYAGSTLPFDEAAARVFGRVVADIRGAGRQARR